MTKKFFNPVLIGVVFVSMVLISVWNVKAYVSAETEIRDYKTERTMIKEILSNQQTMIALLKEIKAAK